MTNVQVKEQMRGQLIAVLRLEEEKLAEAACRRLYDHGITVLEVAVGQACLTLLGVRVWDYRAEWADIAGFVCPKYTVLWYLLCLWLLSCLRLARTLPQRLPQPAAGF